MLGLKRSGRLSLQMPRDKPLVKKPRKVQLSSPRSLRADHLSLSMLPADCLETIVCYLDTRSVLRLLRVDKALHLKLRSSVTFWKHLCKNERFDELNAVKKDENEVEQSRLSFCGKKLHEVVIPEESTFWHRVFLRGTQMRRNIVNGRYEMWRLFMTDTESLPVKKMQSTTTFRELRSQHRKSPFNNPRRRVRIQRYWNEEYMIAVQHSISREFAELFVWKWSECQEPKFLYSVDLRPVYPSGLFPTAFFLWKRFLVLMPDTAHVSEEMLLRSMVRVHDLLDHFSLTGQYDLPDEMRRHLGSGRAGEVAHLHKVGDRAVALCRTPRFRIFVFSLPDCSLLHSVDLPSHNLRPLEQDELDQRFFMKDNSMMFLFYPPDFFDDEDRRHGQLLTVNMDGFLANTGELKMWLDSRFDCNEDYIVKMCLVTPTLMTCVLMSGKVVVRRLEPSYSGRLNKVDLLTIPCPEQLREDLDPDLELDGPNFVTSVGGDLIIVLRNFVSGRKVHAYSSAGKLIYKLMVDDPRLQLEARQGYLTMDLDGQFFCLADQKKVQVWNSRTGQHLNTINLPEHYNYRDDPYESADKFCWKGHTDFAFTEDGIIIVHSQRNFPIAADILLFW